MPAAILGSAEYRTLSSICSIRCQYRAAPEKTKPGKPRVLSRWTARAARRSALHRGALHRGALTCSSAPTGCSAGQPQAQHGQGQRARLRNTRRPLLGGQPFPSTADVAAAGGGRTESSDGGGRTEQSGRGGRTEPSNRGGCAAHSSYRIFCWFLRLYDGFRRASGRCDAACDAMRHGGIQLLARRDRGLGHRAMAHSGSRSVARRIGLSSTSGRATRHERVGGLARSGRRKCRRST